jgi:hypothetical protein
MAVGAKFKGTIEERLRLLESAMIDYAKKTISNWQDIVEDTKSLGVEISDMELERMALNSIGMMSLLSAICIGTMTSMQEVEEGIKMFEHQCQIAISSAMGQLSSEAGEDEKETDPTLN